MSGIYGTTEPQAMHDADCPFKHPPVRQKSVLGGIQHVFRFDNGRGASVVRHSGSYGSEQGLWELAVLSADGHLDYTTPVTDDVEGYLTVEDVDALLDDIAALDAEVA